MVSRISARQSTVHTRSHDPVPSIFVSAIFSAICTPLQYSFPPPKVVFRSDDDRRDEVGISRAAYALLPSVRGILQRVAPPWMVV